MRVEIKDIEQKLAVVFRENSIFNENNIGKDNTVEDKIVNFVLKLSDTFNFSLDNFYGRLKSFNLEPLSIYTNEGLISYDAVNNTGKISLSALKEDDENNYNIDNLFGQLMLMTATSTGKTYGFGDEPSLSALNQACTYMIASNLLGGSVKNDYEEELMALNQLDTTLSALNARIDFVTAYFSNNGALLKNELNNMGINDSILNEINYLNVAKKNGRVVPDKFASIENKINRNFAMMVSNRMITDNKIIEKYKSHLVGDKVLDYSTIGMSKVKDGMIGALEYVNKQNNNMVNINNMKTMQKAA